MTVHVIHDPLRKDRYELLQKEIEQQRLTVQMWDAVKIFPKPRANIREAHFRIIRWAKETNQDEVMVMEDDCHWVTPDAFEYFIRKKPTDFDIYLSSIISGRVLPDNTTSDFAGFQAYIVHNRYYNTFLEADDKRDVDRAQMRKGIFRVCNPFATVQHETFSDNTKKVYRNAKQYFDKTIYDGTNG